MSIPLDFEEEKQKARDRLLIAQGKAILLVTGALTIVKGSINHELEEATKALEKMQEEPGN